MDSHGWNPQYRALDLVFLAMLGLLVGIGLAHLTGLAQTAVLLLVLSLGYGAVALCQWANCAPIAQHRNHAPIHPCGSGQETMAGRCSGSLRNVPGDNLGR